jgi:hypothetical protein
MVARFASPTSVPLRPLPFLLRMLEHGAVFDMPPHKPCDRTAHESKP